MNSLGVSPYVNNLSADLADGLIIFQLYETISPGCVEWPKVTRKFSRMKKFMEKLENCNYAVELGRKQKYSLVGIAGENSVTRWPGWPEISFLNRHHSLNLFAKSRQWRVESRPFNDLSPFLAILQMAKNEFVFLVLKIARLHREFYHYGRSLIQDKYLKTAAVT